MPRPVGQYPLCLLCRHCRHRKIHRPRGLCYSCYYTTGVRDLYPSTSKYARRGVGNFTGNAPVALRPTCFAPGTTEKMEVLAERAKNKQALWHPLDAQYEGDPRPMQYLAGQGSVSDAAVRRNEVQPTRTTAASERSEFSR